MSKRRIKVVCIMHSAMHVVLQPAIVRTPGSEQFSMFAAQSRRSPHMQQMVHELLSK
jgi:hypothetical protein